MFRGRAQVRSELEKTVCGAICEVKALDYLLRKLGDELLPDVAAAEEAERALLTANIRLMCLLTPQDFELLVDLSFSASGWRRIGPVGKNQKTVDFELVLPPRESFLSGFRSIRTRFQKPKTVVF
jgi:hypothetical protein